MKNKKTQLIILIAALSVFLPVAASAALDFNLNYVPMEEIPGFGRPTDFPSYVLAIYKFGLWTIGISAMLMISIGGYMYLTSAGNKSSAGTAKEIIKDAIIGIFVALLSWLFLYTINPDLVAFRSLDGVIDEAARTYEGSYPAIESTIPAGCNSQQWKDIFSQVSASTGVDRCILQATAAIESGCTQVPNRTESGRDCSVMQIAAQENCNTTCDNLEANPQLAVSCAANLIKKVTGVARRSPEEQLIRDTYAGYNGGPGALQPSVDCPAGMKNQLGNDYVKWDCPANCGGYCPVPARTSVFLNYYNQCKNGS